MAEHSIVRTPYNFVPFSNKVLLRYASTEELPHHDRLDPSLKSGEIHVTMTAETPVFVSDGNGKEPHFFRTPNGKCALPGSTIRGMVRENMQILGFGCIHPGEDFEDFQIFFREMAAARGSTGGALKEYYQAALGIKSFRTAEGKPVSVPQNVHAGYLRKGGNGYYIQPVEGTYLRVSRKHPDVVNLGGDPARAVSVAYKASGDRVDHLQQSNLPVPGMKQGMLLFTGNPVGRVPNHLYVFPGADEDAAPVNITTQDALSYKEDWETRFNSLKAYYDPKFWALPEDGEEKPVFYIEYEGHVYFGMSLFLRIGHRHALSEGLPKRHLDALQQEAIDYPHAVFGFAEPDRPYRSRVSFEDLVAVEPGEADKTYQAVLGQPKPSYYPGYVSDGKNYSEEDFRLRGYKQYWLKEVGDIPPGKEKVMSTLRPLPKGTRFCGVIRFKNLHEDELGLLLWCLRLDEGCFQSVGMGKPYGFGRMKLHIDQLLETEIGNLYTPDGLCGGPGVDRTEAVNCYIETYDTYAAGQLYIKRPKKHPSIRSCSEIQDFFYLRSALKTDAEAGYMTLDQYQNVRDALPSAASFREKEDTGADQDAREKSGSGAEPSMEDLKAQLAAKFNRR